MNEQTAKMLVAALELLRRSVSDNTTANLNRLNKIEEMASGLPGWATAAAAGIGAATAASTPAGRDMRPNPDLDAAMGFGPAPSTARPSAHAKPVKVETMRVTVAKMLAMGSQVVVAGQSIPLGAGGGMLALPPAQPGAVARRPGAPLSTDHAAPAVRVIGFTANKPGDGGGAARPPGGRQPSPAPGEPPGGGGMALLLTRLFGRIIAPLVSLHAVLSQTTSGFGVFQKALNVFASAVAPILLPVFAILAAAVVAVSGEIFTALLPHLRKWYGYILDTAIPTTKLLVERLVELGKTIAWVIEVARDPSKLVRGTDAERAEGGGPNVGRTAGRIQSLTDPLGINRFLLPGAGFGGGGGRPLVSPDALRTLTDPLRLNRLLLPGLGFLGGSGASPGGGAAQRNTAPGADGKDAASQKQGGNDSAAASAPSPFDRALSDVTRSLQMSLGPKASYTGLTEVGKQAQLAALNQDPLDARVLKQSIQTIQEFLAAIRDNTGRAADRPVNPTGGRS